MDRRQAPVGGDVPVTPSWPGQTRLDPCRLDGLTRHPVWTWSAVMGFCSVVGVPHVSWLPTGPNRPQTRQDASAFAVA